MKRKLVISLLLLSLVALALLSACGAAATSTTATAQTATKPQNATTKLTTSTSLATTGNMSGSDFQYNMLLSGDTSGKEVLKQWTGRGDKVTEEFTMSTAPWEVYSSNTPDSANWQVEKGDLKITVVNKDIGKSTEVWNSYRPNESTYGMSETGKFYLEIKSTNTRWIVRIRK